MPKFTSQTYKRLFLVLLLPATIISSIVAYRHVPMSSIVCKGSCYTVPFDYVFKVKADEGRVFIRLEKEYDSLAIPFESLKTLAVTTSPFYLENADFNVVSLGSESRNNKLTAYLKEVTGDIIAFTPEDKLAPDLAKLYEKSELFVCDNFDYIADAKKIRANCGMPAIKSFAIELPVNDSLRELHETIVETIAKKEKSVVYEFYRTVLAGPVTLLLVLFIIFIFTKACRYVFKP